ncbi:MAG: ABC transporter permease [Lachnospiraceae bacterium]|nr:ABC transporter permease [Lachnospiraceae bacterium]
MQLFNTYFKFIYRKKSLILTYVLIFSGLSIAMMVVQNKSGGAESYVQKKVDIAIVDRDQSAVSKALTKYLEGQNTRKKIKDDEDSFKNELYWRNVNYILVIPDGFEQDVMQGKQNVLSAKKVRDAVETAYVEEEIGSFLNLYTLYLNAGYSTENAVKKTKHDLAQKASVTLEKRNDGRSERKNVGALYYQYLPYVMISVGILIVAAILVIFYQEDVKKRCICSSTSLKEQNKQLIFASLFSCFLLTAFFYLLGLVVTKGKLIGQVHFWFYGINAFCFMLVVLALSFLLANMVHTENGINGCSNVLSLALCFLGGIFVPYSIMPDAVVKAAHFIPTYWYTMALEEVAYMTKVTPEFLREFSMDVLVEVVFAFTMLSAGLLLSKRRRVFS